MQRQRLVSFAALLMVALLPASDASAFCGFYVSGAEGSLYANATMVVLMRSGTRTVLSMQNDYQGPPESFAMIVPVPTVLSASDVHTLPREIFERVDSLSAPRLVEYWEEDPCAYARSGGGRLRRSPSSRGGGGGGGAALAGADLGVRVEAEFAVGEYDIAILSADDSSGLETWLHREHYNIPVGASAVLRPYVEAGTHFFVARVDPSRVTFEHGHALLSPLRVQYDSPELTLPVRLGLLNSNGEQDLIVHILAPGTRYEAANYTNAFIPTNLRVRNGVRRNFGRFYETLFRETIRADPRTVVTEYAWTATTCDPCPTTPLSDSELSVLGADVMPAVAGGRGRGGWTLTRLHYRYDAGSLGDDLVFREASSAIGGRGIPEASGSLDQEVATAAGGAGSHASSAFQGRYVILHWWPRAITCESPERGNWGGPPRGSSSTFVPPRTITEGLPTPYRSLGRWVRDDISALGIEAVESSSAGTGRGTAPASGSGGAGGSGSAGGGAAREGGGPHAALTGSGSRGELGWALSLAALPVFGVLLARRRAR